MITEQEARHAALRESLARISDHKRGVAVPRYADKAALTLPSMLLADLCMVAECYQQELARREAERIELAKPIDVEWLRSIELPTPDGHAWRVLMSHSVDEYETEVRACIRSDGGCKVVIYQQDHYDRQYGGEMSECVLLGYPKNRGQLLDLLKALKGGA